MNLQNEIINSRWLMSNEAVIASYSSVIEMIFNQNLSLEQKKEYLRERDEKYKVKYLNSNFTSTTVSDKPKPSGSVAMIDIEGAITKNDGLCNKGTETMRKELSIAGSDPSVSGVILNINSPGGSVWGTENFAKDIKNFRAKYNKPIATYVDGMACSAGYWLGSASDKVFISGETCELGCIGTKITMQDQRERLAAMGVKEVTVNASKSFNKNSVYEEAINGNTEPLKTELLDPINEVFLKSVTEARGTKLSTFTSTSGNNFVSDVLSGKTYIGNKAIEVGLADQIGSLEDVVSYIEQESLSLTTEFNSNLKAKVNHNFLNKQANKMNVKDLMSSLFKSMGIVSAVTDNGNTLTLEQVVNAMPDGQFASKLDFENLQAMVNSLKENQLTAEQVSNLIASSAFDAAPLEAKLTELNEKVKEVSEIVADSKAPVAAVVSNSNGSSSYPTTEAGEKELTWETFVPRNAHEQAYKNLGNTPDKRAKFLKEIKKYRNENN